MDGIELLIERAKKRPKRIVLPEAEDTRVLEAAKRLASEKIAEVVLIDAKGGLKSGGRFAGEVITPADYPRIGEIANAFYCLRKHKGVTEAEAKEIVVKDSLYLGAMMTRMGIVDGLVAGALHMTRDVIKAAICCIDIDRRYGIISGAFVIETEHFGRGASGLFIFADCAVIPEPSAKQLAQIAASGGDLLKTVFGVDPKIAFLTYSSKGSAEGESIDRAREALLKIKEKRPDIVADGELQLDAAVIPEVCRRKSPGSPLQGGANVLIFPNLDAGNITYKTLERLGGAKAVGPALLGLTKPLSDLSRGCSVEDIVNSAALTVVRAQLGLQDAKGC